MLGMPDRCLGVKVPHPYPLPLFCTRERCLIISIDESVRPFGKRFGSTPPALLFIVTAFHSALTINGRYDSIQNVMFVIS